MEHLNTEAATDAAPQPRALSGDARTQAARKWLRDFDAYTQGAFYTADDNQRTAQRLLESATRRAVEAAKEAGILARFPVEFTDCGAASGIAELESHARQVRQLIAGFLRVDRELMSDAAPLLSLLALQLLHAQNADFADQLKNAYWFGLGDERAGDREHTPMYSRLFEIFLDHSRKREEFERSGLLPSEVIEEGDQAETVETLAKRWEEDFVALVDSARDRLALVTRTLRHFTPTPKREDEDENGFQWRRRLWEEERGETFTQLCAEKAMWQEWLQTPELETIYWYGRGVDNDLREDAARPSLSLVLDDWKRRGIAGDDITLDQLCEEIFQET